MLAIPPYNLACTWLQWLYIYPSPCPAWPVSVTDRRPGATTDAWALSQVWTVVLLYNRPRWLRNSMQDIHYGVTTNGVLKAFTLYICWWTRESKNKNSKMFNSVHAVVLNNYPSYNKIHRYKLIFFWKYKITVYESFKLNKWHACTVNVKWGTKYGKGV